MKNSQKLINIVTASLLAALCCVGTLVLQIPTPTGGFVNLGDTVILLSAFLLSPVYAALSAGIGSMLADIIAGYPQYAPATFVIKIQSPGPIFVAGADSPARPRPKAVETITG